MNDQDTYAGRLATKASAAVLAEVDAAYDDREEAASLMYLLMVAERVAELGGPTADPRTDIDVYSLMYKTTNGTVVVDNDQRWCDEGECTVAYYHGDGWRELGEADEGMTTFRSITAAAKHAVELIRTRS